jgi:hypothetical protein
MIKPLLLGLLIFVWAVVLCVFGAEPAADPRGPARPPR